MISMLCEREGQFTVQVGLEVARYVTDMIAQLEAMAVAARLDLLAYFLSMAKAEGVLYVRGNGQADGPRVESGEIGPVDSETDNENPLDGRRAGL